MPSRPTDIFTSVEATGSTIDSVFGIGQKRRLRFHNFLRQGCIGHFFTKGGSLAAYAWLSPFGKSAPHHMRTLRNKETAWIFSCRTLDPFRSQGLFKCCIFELNRLLLRKFGSRAVFIDTESGNIAAIRAVNSLGFEPYGTAEGITIKIPVLYSWSYARWIKVMHVDLTQRCQGANPSIEPGLERPKSQCRP